MNISQRDLEIFTYVTYKTSVGLGILTSFCPQVSTGEPKDHL